MLPVVADHDATPTVPASSGSLIDEIVRDGTRRMLAAALEVEVAAYIAAHTQEIDEHGRRLVVRNGHAVPHQVLTSAGAVEVGAPAEDRDHSRRAVAAFKNGKLPERGQHAGKAEAVAA